MPECSPVTSSSLWRGSPEVWPQTRLRAISSLMVVLATHLVEPPGLVAHFQGTALTSCSQPR